MWGDDNITETTFAVTYDYIQRKQDNGTYKAAESIQESTISTTKSKVPDPKQGSITSKILRQSSNFTPQTRRESRQKHPPRRPQWLRCQRLLWPLRPLHCQPPLRLRRSGWEAAQERAMYSCQYTPIFG